MDCGFGGKALGGFAKFVACVWLPVGWTVNPRPAGHGDRLT